MRSVTLYRSVRLANVVVFALAVALLFDATMAAAVARYDSTPHWRTEQRALTVVDRTSDPRWQAATRQAVAVWNEAAEGTGLTLTWAAGTGSCRAGATSVEICAVANQTLNRGRTVGREGVANVDLAGDRSQPHIERAGVLVCGDCWLATGRRQVVATHELGHVLGLPHTDRRGSLMTEIGSAAAPDAQDVAELRAVYAHADGPDRCGFFDVRLGPLCF